MKVKLTPVSNCFESSLLLAKMVDFKAFKKELGSIFKEVPLSTNGKLGYSSEGIPLRLKEPLSLLIKIFSEFSSTSKKTGVSLGNLFTISDKSFEGIVIAPLFLTVPSKEVWIPKLRSNPVKLILFVPWSAVKSIFARIGWVGLEATASVSYTHLRAHET